MMIVFIIILLLFGAKKIPELARGLGKSMGEFKKAREDFEREITTAEHDVKFREPTKKQTRDEIDHATSDSAPTESSKKGSQDT